MKNKALFLDRDGVINIEKNYVHKIKDFEFVTGIFELCKKYQDKGFLIIIITNQAGIAREYYTQRDFDVLTSWMIKEFESKNIEISHVYYCPHHPDFTGQCFCRKPNTKMINDASKKFNLDLNKSILIGDKLSDIECGEKAKIGLNILIEPNKLPTNLVK
jgi:D-glycero-D-manno-heptose 1,7-bisphosphate phosphatase